MEIAELNKILNDENKKISLEEYQNVLYQLKNDTISMSTAEQFENQELTKKYHFYEGETNAFDIALELSKHIKSLQTQKAIECLKEIKQFCDKETFGGIFTSLDNRDFDENYVGGFIASNVLEEYIDKKIKELEGKDDRFI